MRKAQNVVSWSLCMCALFLCVMVTQFVWSEQVASESPQDADRGHQGRYRIAGFQYLWEGRGKPHGEVTKFGVFKIDRVRLF